MPPSPFAATRLFPPLLKEAQAAPLGGMGVVVAVSISAWDQFARCSPIRHIQRNGLIR